MKEHHNTTYHVRNGILNLEHMLTLRADHLTILDDNLLVSSALALVRFPATEQLDSREGKRRAKRERESRPTSNKT